MDEGSVEGPLEGGLDDPSPSPLGRAFGSFNFEPGGFSLEFMFVLLDDHGKNPPREPGRVGVFSNGPSNPPESVL